MAKKWTDIEDSILKEQYPILGTKVVLNGRTINSIATRASFLKLKVINHKFNTTIYKEILLDKDIEVLEEYINSKTSISHKCLYCDNIWKTAPINITRIRSSGCPKCNKGYGYDLKLNNPKKASLYILEIIVGEYNFIKVGVTCRPLNARVNELHSSLKPLGLPKLNILYTIDNSFTNILKLEDTLLSLFEHYTFKDFKFSGSTELLNINTKESMLKYLEGIT